MIDGTGREFNDDLTDFLEWYLAAGVQMCVPLERSIHFVDGLNSCVIYRHEPYQVEFLTVKPDVYIPPHTHPNVDSYEVALRGMEFWMDGKTILPLWWAMKGNDDNNLPNEWYNKIRVLPSSEHSAKASSSGGAFMSVQKWLNGVEPSAVGMDWKGGSVLGDSHTNQITSTEVAGEAPTSPVKAA